MVTSPCAQQGGEPTATMVAAHTMVKSPRRPGAEKLDPGLKTFQSTHPGFKV